MKIRESCLQTGNFIYKPGISLTKQDFHLQRGSLGLQRGFSGYYLPGKVAKIIYDGKVFDKKQKMSVRNDKKETHIIERDKDQASKPDNEIQKGTEQK